MSFQNRLSYFQDRRNARLLRNAAALSGVHTDVILVNTFRNATYDVRQQEIREVIFIPIVFPFESLEKMQARMVKTATGEYLTHLATLPDTVLSIYPATEKVINKDDLLFWLIEDYSLIGNNSAATTPAILLLRIKDITVHFGSYGITHKKFDCTTEDPSSLPVALMDAFQEAHQKRRPKLLADHNRIQFEAL